MNQPFLPEPEVTVATAPKKSGMKVLILWVVLIMMFLAIWQFLSPSDGSRAARQEPQPECVTSFWSSTAITLVPLLVVFLLVIVFLRAYRQNLDFARAQEAGRMAMAQRRFVQASELFAATLPRFAKQPNYRYSVMLNVAEAELHAGRLDGALAACAEIERSRRFVLGSAVRVRVATLTALVYAIRGELQSAERWTADARLRIARSKEERLVPSAQLCLAEAVVACRKGAPTEAIALLDRTWNELRYSLSADAMRLVETVRAFAEAQAGLRASNTVAERLVRVEPVGPGELSFLGVGWPEMSAFLSAHGLGDARVG